MILPRDRPSSQATRVESAWIPRIIIAAEAAHKMMVATLHFKTEVAWFGLVDADTSKAEYRLTEVLFPEQEAAGHTVEVQAEHVAEFSMKLLEERGENDYNRLRLWGHSHHSMGVSPSGQDNTTLKNLTADSEDFFIAVRTNHDLMMEFDIGYKGGITFRSVPYKVERIDVKDDPFIAELEAKVKPFKPPPLPQGYVYNNQGYYDHKAKQWVSQKDHGSGKALAARAKEADAKAGAAEDGPDYFNDPLPHYHRHPTLLTTVEQNQQNEFFKHMGGQLEANLRYCARLVTANKWKETVGLLLGFGPKGEEMLDGFIDEFIEKEAGDENFATLLEMYATKTAEQLMDDEIIQDMSVVEFD